MVFFRMFQVINVKKRFLLLILLFIFDLVSAEYNINMKNIVYTKTNFIYIKDLFEENFNVLYRIDIPTNTYIANQDVVNMLTGLKQYNYIVLGKGTKVLKIQEFEKIDFFHYVIQKYPYFDSSKISSEERRFLESKFIVKIDEKLQLNYVCFDITYVEFEEIAGKPCQYSLLVNLRDLYSEETNLYTNEGDQHCFFFEQIDKNSGILNLKKGNLTIKMKVKIRRKLEPDEFIVENYSSGKIFRVSLKREEKDK